MTIRRRRRPRLSWPGYINRETRLGHCGWGWRYTGYNPAQSRTGFVVPAVLGDSDREVLVTGSRHPLYGSTTNTGGGKDDFCRGMGGAGGVGCLPRGSWTPLTIYIFPSSLPFNHHALVELSPTTKSPQPPNVANSSANQLT